MCIKNVVCICILVGGLHVGTFSDQWLNLHIRKFNDLCCRQEVLLLDNEIGFNEAVIEERDQGIQEIQQQIGEVNEIFKDLAVLVHEQGALIGKSSSLSPASLSL